jgi:hypothetical protein
METQFVKDILTVLDPSDGQKVKSMFLNYSISGESFEDAFELIKYRLRTDRSGFEDAGFAV